MVTVKWGVRNVRLWRERSQDCKTAHIKIQKAWIFKFYQWGFWENASFVLVIIGEGNFVSQDYEVTATHFGWDEWLSDLAVLFPSAPTPLKGLIPGSRLPICLVFRSGWCLYSRRVQRCLHEFFEAHFMAFLVKETFYGSVASSQTPVSLHKILEEELKGASKAVLKNGQALLSWDLKAIPVELVCNAGVGGCE